MIYNKHVFCRPILQMCKIFLSGPTTSQEIATIKYLYYTNASMPTMQRTLISAGMSCNILSLSRLYRNQSECMKYMTTKLKSLATIKCNITVSEKIHNMQEHKTVQIRNVVKKLFQNAQRSRSSTPRILPLRRISFCKNAR